MKTSRFFIEMLTILMAVLVTAAGARIISSRVERASSVSCQCHSNRGILESKPSGVVEDCCCDYGTVNSINIQVLYPLLEALVRTPFFRYFEVKLQCECPFWPSNDISYLPDGIFKNGNEAFKCGGDIISQEGNPEAMVVGKTLDLLGLMFNVCISRDNPWTWDDERNEKDVTCVDLLQNPEIYTGYSARRIWDAIYTENVLKCEKDAPVERRVLYQLISGLHSSISVHIAAQYLVDDCKHIYGLNLTVLEDRVLKHPGRVHNLYFTFLVVLRSVSKASDYLLHVNYNTGNSDVDEQTKILVKELVQNDELRAACPLPFDEAKLWQGREGHDLLEEMQTQFRNVTALMNCVGCERCRLWAKLQFLGLGTALDILFNGSSQSIPDLQRNEVVALVNLLNRLSESIYYLHKFGPLVHEVSFA